MRTWVDRARIISCDPSARTLRASQDDIFPD
jgi:hypothetical protein